MQSPAKCRKAIAMTGVTMANVKADFSVPSKSVSVASLRDDMRMLQNTTQKHNITCMLQKFAIRVCTYWSLKAKILLRYKSHHTCNSLSLVSQKPVDQVHEDAPTWGTLASANKRNWKQTTAKTKQTIYNRTAAINIQLKVLMMSQGSKRALSKHYQTEKKSTIITFCSLSLSLSLIICIYRRPFAEIDIPGEVGFFTLRDDVYD